MHKARKADSDLEFLSRDLMKIRLFAFPGGVGLDEWILGARVQQEKQGSSRPLQPSAPHTEGRGEADEEGTGAWQRNPSRLWQDLRKVLTIILYYICYNAPGRVHYNIITPVSKSCWQVNILYLYFKVSFCFIWFLRIKKKDDSLWTVG